MNWVMRHHCVVDATPRPGDGQRSAFENGWYVDSENLVDADARELRSGRESLEAFSRSESRRFAGANDDCNLRCFDCCDYFGGWNAPRTES